MFSTWLISARDLHCVACTEFRRAPHHNLILSNRRSRPIPQPRLHNPAHGTFSSTLIAHGHAQHTPTVHTHTHTHTKDASLLTMDIRVLRPSDIPHVQLANITNLPENYFCKYYLYHAMSWPQLSYVAVDVSFLFFPLHQAKR